MQLNNWSVADICDQFGGDVTVLDRNYVAHGAIKKCHGQIQTVSLDTDNRQLIDLLSMPGDGKVAFAFSPHKDAALVGDRLAEIALSQKWSGIIVDGAARDLGKLKNIKLPIFSNTVYPIRGARNGGGVIGAKIILDEIEITSGLFLYADLDGIVISAKNFLNG